MDFKVPDSPTEYLINFGSSKESLLLIGAPIGILVILFVGFGLLVWKRNKKDEEKLLENIEAEAGETDLGGAEDEIQWTTEQSDIESTSWLKTLVAGLSKTRAGLIDGLKNIIGSSSRIDDQLLEKLQEHLYKSDIGVKTSDILIDHVRKIHGSSQEITFEDVCKTLQGKALEILTKPNSSPTQDEGTIVYLIVGVNGAGKTTSIGKLASRFKGEGKSVLLCAADTYRAAAIDQLKVWGDRLEIEVVAKDQGSDPAAVAFDAAQLALSKIADVLLVDTAGRLHNKKDLMDELAKINRVIGKAIPGAPHETWLVLDATTGQNALKQAEAFNEVANLTGVIVTKLDGTAKGGVIIGLAHQYNLPIQFVGVGEKERDLQKFSAVDFTNSLFQQ